MCCALIRERKESENENSERRIMIQFSHRPFVLVKGRRSFCITGGGVAPRTPIQGLHP